MTKDMGNTAFAGVGIFSWKFFCILGLIFTAAFTTRATTVYVDLQIGSATCATYNPSTRSCAGGTETAYRTIAAASAAATPGTIIIIRGGTYAEQLRPASSGVAGNPITYQAATGESVKVGTGSTSSPGMNLSDRSYLIIDGLRVEDRAWCEARNMHYSILRNCVFLRNPQGGTTGNVRLISANYNQLLNCTIVDGHDNLCIIDANYNLVQGCTMGDAVHAVLTLRCGDYNVIRGNYMWNSLQKISEVYDCGGDTSAVPNSFDSTSHNVFEDNFYGGAIPGVGYNDTTSNGNGIQYGGQDGIIRRNIFTRCNVGIGIQVYSDESLHNENNRLYHNVFFANPGPALAPRAGNVDNKYKNNILFQNGGCISGCTEGISPGQIVYRIDSLSAPLGVGALFENNDIIYQTPGQPVMEVEFASSGRTLAQFNAATPGILVNTLEADPQFVDSAQTNFHLKASSPMIDAGAFLTRTASAGSGTTMPVLDAFYFYDGFGIPGEVGDVIQLQGQTQTARITKADYTAKTLTLDRSLTWSASQGISLKFNGTAPDVGAFEFGVAGINLGFALEGTTLRLSWPADSGYTLVASQNATGPYDPIPGANGSYSETISGGTKFFQLKK